MAINLFNKYGSRANPPSMDYPEGSIKNRSAPDVKDGTPLDADWANDHQGFFQSLLSAAGIAASGTPDKVGDSQYFDALKSVIPQNIPSSTELTRGVAKIATSATAQGFLDDLDIITSKKLADSMKGGNSSLLSSGFQKFANGLIFQWASVTHTQGQATITFPITFPNAVLNAQFTPMISSYTTDGWPAITNVTQSNITVYMPSASLQTKFILAIGH
jgi:hypothetical protein